MSILLLQHTADTCPGCFWSWAGFMFLSLALGVGIGKWIWGKYASSILEKDKQLKQIKSKNIQLEKEFIDVKYQLDESIKDNKGLKASLAESQSSIVALSTQMARFRKEIENKKTIQNTDAKLADAKPIPSSKIKEENASETIDNESKNQSKIKEVSLEKTTKSPISSETKLDKENIDTPASNLESSSDYSIYANHLKKDDLKIVEGIGPKIEEILKKAGLKNWEELAAADTELLQNILHDAGPRYRIHNPKTWNHQAQLAAKNDWKNLIHFQKELNAKNANIDSSTVVSKIEKLLAKKLEIPKSGIDDLL